MGGPSSFRQWADQSQRGVASVVLPAGLEIGHRYRVKSLLGMGGMGAVYLVHDKGLDRDVALKLIRSDIAEDPDALERFKREIQLSSRVTHSNVLRVFDLGESDGIQFLTMQFVDGRDLSTILKKQGKLPVERLLRVFRQTAEGLKAAHDQGVIHRDLKPQNIMLDSADRVYVTDFGMAKSSEQSGMTQTGAVIGTPFYMSPEQVKGEPVGPQSDIFSLGVILYQMATGTVPFSGATPFEVMMVRVQRRPKPAKELTPELPVYLQKIIERCLVVDPALRYQNVGQILADLDSESRPLGDFVPSDVAPLAQADGGGDRPSRCCSRAAVSGSTRKAGEPRSPPRSRNPCSWRISPITPAMRSSTEHSSPLSRSPSRAPRSSARTTGARHARSPRSSRRAPPASTRPSPASSRFAKASTSSRPDPSTRAGAATRSPSGRSTPAPARPSSRTGRALPEKRRSSPPWPGSPRRSAGPSATRRPNPPSSPPPRPTPPGHWKPLTSTPSRRTCSGKATGTRRSGTTRRALDLDRNLGRAYAGLAAVESNRGQRQAAEKNYKEALARIDRMSEREKYRTRGGYYLLMRNPDNAIDEFSALVKQFPADTAGIANLAFAYFVKRDMANALTWGRRAIEIYPKNVPQRNNFGLIAMYAGDFDTGAREQKTVLQMNSQFVLAYVGLALSELGAGRPEQALATWNRLAATGPAGASSAAAGLADLALYQGRIGDARKLLETAIEADVAAKNTEEAARKLTTLAEAELASGQAARAIAAAERATGMSEDLAVVVSAARVLIEAGEEKKALAAAAQLAARLEPDPQMYAALLQGEADLKRRNYRDAIARLKEARKLADSWLVRYDLGRAYLEAGSFAEADAEFDACVKRRGEAAAVYLDEVPTFRVFPPVYYYLGRTREGLKSPGAAEAFQTFLGFQTGEGGPLAADARRRLAGK